MNEEKNNAQLFRTTTIKLCNPINITMPIRILIGHVNHVREKKLLHGGRDTLYLAWYARVPRWFSVGICKYRPGYKSHDLL